MCVKDTLAGFVNNYCPNTQQNEDKYQVSWQELSVH